MSLKSNLQQLIKDRNGGIVTLKEIEDFCHKSQYKTSNAERRLRPSDSPDITPVWNEKETAIIGYRYLQAHQTQESAITAPKTPEPDNEPLYNFNGELLTKRK